jgi:hypothetical protein
MQHSPVDHNVIFSNQFAGPALSCKIDTYYFTILIYKSKNILIIF